MPANDAELQWKKSSRSGSYGQCVEVAFAANRVFVRDSKDPDGGRLEMDVRSWAAFVNAVRAGEFDLPTRAG